MHRLPYVCTFKLPKGCACGWPEREHLKLRAIACSLLDARERYIVEQRMLADDELSLAELGRQLGVSRERARQLEARARKKLRATLADLEPQREAA